MTTPSLPDAETDVLVVGSGASGLAAALTAAECGARVLVIDSSHRFGGTSSTSGGVIWVPCNHLIAPAGGSDTEAEALRYLHELVGGDASEARIQAFVRQAPRMFRFFNEQCGIEFESLESYCDYHPELPGGKPGFRSCQALSIKSNALGQDAAILQEPHLGSTAFGRINFTAREAHTLVTQAKGAKWTFMKVLLKYVFDIGQRWKTSLDRRLTGGGALVARLMQAARKRKVELRLSTALTDYLVENGRVVGAVVSTDGVSQRILAGRGVIVASGGFERNARMRAQYMPQPTSTAWGAGVLTNTGEPILAAQRIGIAMGNMGSAWWAPAFKLSDEDRTRPLFVERALPGCIMVDEHARRFCNEAASYHVTGGIMAHGEGGEARRAWLVFDKQFRGKYALGPLFPGPPKMDAWLPPSMRAILEKADTVADLARKMRVAPDALEATISRFNEMAKAGKDLDYQRGESLVDRYYSDAAVKPNPSLAPLAQAPYYALPLFAGDIGTNGGILTDEHAQALTEGGAPMPGLYAVGNCSASVMGRSYPAAGGTLGPAMTFGYVAARHALGMADG
ncbi:MAG: FAD-dependent oxidoreductase [Steroidobacteraceae bacterium]